jgi:hypothetical protein
MSLAATDRPVIDGLVSGRNAGRGRSIYNVTPFTERPFRINEHLRLELRHRGLQFCSIITTSRASAGCAGAVPRQDGRSDTLAGSTSQLPACSIQFALKVRI